MPLSALRHALLIPLLAGLMACAARPGPEVLVPDAAQVPAVAGRRDMAVFVATTRGRGPETPPVYDNGRVRNANFARFDLSVPPGPVTAGGTWADAAPDDGHRFVTTGRRDFGAAKDFRAALRTAGRGKSGVLVYVHGYNTSLEEGVLRSAQIVADADGTLVPVLFSWPSSGRAAGYVADRDAADFSRRALAELLRIVAAEPWARRVFVVGHSMGGRLTMEALLQLRLAGHARTLDRLDVALADPDIDISLFWEQAGMLGPMHPPLTVLTATDDKALRISRFLAGGRERMGAIDVSDPAVARTADAFGVRIIDFSTLDSSAMAHDRIVQMAGLFQGLPAASGGHALRGAGAFVLAAFGASAYAVISK